MATNVTGVINTNAAKTARSKSNVRFTLNIY
jgi:hypothetical protein